MSQPLPTPDVLAATSQIIAADQAQSTALRESLTAYIQRLWASLGRYSNAEMAEFIQQIVPVVAGAQSSASAVMSASLAAQQQLIVGGLGIPAPINATKISGAAVRRGVDPAEVYARPFHLVWRQLDELPREPGSIDQAIQSGLDRAIQLAMTDVELAKTATAQKVLATDAKVSGYRRVLEGPHSCGLCIVASTLRYHHATLMPIHPGCDCSVAPIYGDHDPGLSITSMVNVDGVPTPIAELADVHDRIQQRFGNSSSAARGIRGTRGANGRLLQYRDALITHEHGELGPVLAVRGAPFKGPGDI